MKSITKKVLSFVASTALIATFAYGESEVEKVMKERGLSQQDLLAAVKTYTPSGGRDKYIVFSSGGQSGQIMVYGVPSMRILKFIGVFTPEPWQGWGYDDDTKKILKQGWIRGKEITWGDTTNLHFLKQDGKYDGKWLVIYD